MHKNIAGLKVTTTNKDRKAEHDLWKLWENFYQKDFFEGNYDVYVGRETENSENNFENILVDWEKFEIFEFEYTSPESVFEAWKTIWENKNINRAYTYDIEEYYEEGKFRIYISVN